MSQVQENIPTEPKVPPQILVMEDESSIAEGLKMILTEEGYGVDMAMTGKSALNTLGKKGFDLLVADLRLPDIDGMEVVKQVKENKPETEVIIITGYGSVPSAVEAMKVGVFDYLPKPFTEDEFKSAVEGALKEKEAGTDKERFQAAEIEDARLIQKREVVRALNRAAKDEDFWCELMENGSKALDKYLLSNKLKGLIASGDLEGIKEHVGELTPEQVRFLQKRGQREAW